MLSNEQIERGLERCDGGQLACKAFGNEDKHVIYGAIRVVLEAMKFPEPEEEKKEDILEMTSAILKKILGCLPEKHPYTWHPFNLLINEMEQNIRELFKEVEE